MEKKIDSKWLIEVSKGNDLAFRNLYKHWEPKLSSYIFQVTQSKELTAEIIQDVFLKIWMTKETLADIKNFDSYLFVISKNQALNALKKRLLELEKLKFYLNENPKEAFFDEPETSTYSIIDEAIEQLSPRQKEIYLFHRYERLSYQEIANRLGIGKESVKTHLSLAIKSIKGYIQNKISILLLLIEIISKK